MALVDVTRILAAVVAPTTATPYTRMMQLAPVFGLSAGEVTLPGFQNRIAEILRTHEGLDSLTEGHHDMLHLIISDEAVAFPVALQAIEALADAVEQGRVRPKDAGDAAAALQRVTGVSDPADAAGYFCTHVTVAQRIVQKLLVAGTIDEAIQVVLQEYPEMQWLTGEVNATPERWEQPAGTSSVSQRLFAGKKHMEFDRTAVGIMTFLWVLKGDYQSFTACQPGKNKLTEASFAELQSFTQQVLQSNPDALDALIVYTLALDALTVYTVDNDLGKVVSMVDFLVKQAGIGSVDHDKILYDLLSRHPHVSPSFNRLPERYQTLILNGLKADFNLGQFMQAENVPASLAGLVGIDQASLDFYLLHFIYDLAGAGGQGLQNGSIVLIEDTYRNFQASVTALAGLQTGESLEQVYRTYLKERARSLALNIDDPTDLITCRVCCMFRISNPNDAKTVREAFLSLPPNAQAILKSEMSRHGTDDGFAILPYYGPGLLVNLRNALAKIGDANPLQHAALVGLKMLAQIYQLGRIALRKREGNGVFIINAKKLADAAAATPLELEKLAISLRPVGPDAELEVNARPVIDSARFQRVDSLAEVPGQRIAMIGIGGGSDGIQAAMFGKLLQRAGKTVSAILSVRTKKTGSQGHGGAIGESRTISGHGGEVISGVYRVTPESRGSGRFLEFLVAADFRTYLVVDRGDAALTSQIRAVLDELGEVDTVIAVDTGGDALFSMTGQDQARATPDQDLRVLQTLMGIRETIVTSEIAPGVDSPDNASAVLQQAGAWVYTLTPEDRDTVLATYAAWHMTGEDPDRFGKTSLAWQAALRGETGLQVLPLPTSIVLDGQNPWNPFVHVDPSMADIFFMPLNDHLQAIKPQEG